MRKVSRGLKKDEDLLPPSSFCGSTVSSEILINLHCKLWETIGRDESFDKCLC